MTECSICFEKCTQKICSQCNNYCHLECIKKYIKKNPTTINYNNNSSINIKCFICKKEDCGFKLTKSRFNYIFMDKLTNATEYICEIGYLCNIMIYNEGIYNCLLYDLLIKHVYDSRNILYYKDELFKSYVDNVIMLYKDILKTNETNKYIRELNNKI